MTVTTGKFVFNCPIDGREVELHKDCMNCKKLKHWGVSGARPYVTCDILVSPPQREVAPPKQKSEDMSGLRRW